MSSFTDHVKQYIISLNFKIIKKNNSTRIILKLEIKAYYNNSTKESLTASLILDCLCMKLQLGDGIKQIVYY